MLFRARTIASNLLACRTTMSGPLFEGPDEIATGEVDKVKDKSIKRASRLCHAG